MPDRDDEVLVLDINDTKLAEGEAQELDLKEDFQARSAPPPKGKYLLALFVDDDKIEVNPKPGFTKEDLLKNPNSCFYKKQVTCKIMNDGIWKDSIVFESASSGIPRGKKISKMAGMLVMMGVKIPTRISDLAITKLFIKAVKQIGAKGFVADCDWSTWDRHAGKGEYGEALLVGMLNFPKKADGSYHHIVKNKKSEEFVAKLKIVRWIGKAEAEVVSQPKSAINGQVKPIAAKKEEVIEEVPTVEGTAMSFDDDGEIVLEG